MRRVSLRIQLLLVLLIFGAFLRGADGQEKGLRDANERSSGSRFAPAIEQGRQVLNRIVESGNVPGIAISVTVDGQIVWSESRGYAILEHQVPVTGQTRFGLGSISKTLTMAAVMSMVDDGLLDLDAPIERYLTDFPHKGKGVTIRRLAVHQSGVSDAFAVEHSQTAKNFPTIDAAYQLIKNGAMEYEPGTKVNYATGVYTIIARAMEVVSGKSFVEIMNERVFDPAGMLSTVPNDRRKLIPNRTGFYLKSNGAFENGPFFDPSFKLPGAGFLATADDVARFGAALLRPGMLSKQARDEMFKPVPLNSGAPTEFALGLRYSEESGRVILHQPGGGIGISTWLFIHPKDDLVIAVLSNEPNGPVGGRTYREIAKVFLEAIAKTK